jgi:hypothetical protein
MNFRCFMRHRAVRRGGLQDSERRVDHLEIIISEIGQAILALLGGGAVISLFIMLLERVSAM